MRRPLPEALFLGGSVLMISIRKALRVSNARIIVYFHFKMPSAAASDADGPTLARPACAAGHAEATVGAAGGPF